MSFSRLGHYVSDSSSAAVGSTVRSSSAVSQASSDKIRHVSAQFRSLYTGEQAYVIQVKDKLKKHDAYKDLKDAQLTDQAVHLIQKEKLMTDFSHLFEDGLEEAILGNNDEEFHLVNPEEHRMKQERHKLRYSLYANLPIVLYLSMLSAKQRETTELNSLFCSGARLIGCNYGAVHAAIRVGDVYLEWGRESLVIPRRIAPKEALDNESLVSFFADIRTHSEYHTHVEIARKAIQTKSEEVEHMIKTAQAKHEAISKLVDVICRYNCTYCYNIVCTIARCLLPMF